MARPTPTNRRKHRRLTVRILIDYLASGGVYCDYATTLGAALKLYHQRFSEHTKLLSFARIVAPRAVIGAGTG